MIVLAWDYIDTLLMVGAGICILAFILLYLKLKKDQDKGSKD